MVTSYETESKLSLPYASFSQFLLSVFTQYLILLKQGSNIISYNSKQRSNVSRTFLLFIKKSLSIARVSFNEPRLPKNTLGINGIVFFCF